MTLNDSLNFPPLWKRMGAYLIDIYFIFMASYAIIAILPDAITEIGTPLVIILFLFYDPICNSTLGFTFGAWLFKFRVRSEIDLTRKIGFIKALIRFVVKLLLGWVSFLSIHSDPYRRAIHDHAAGSVVIVP